MVTHLKVVSWNADGLSNKVSELKYFLTNNNVDIMFIDELKFQQGQVINVRGYVSYIKLRPNSRFGGVGVLVRDCLPHVITKNNSLSSIEHIILTLQNNISLIGVYNSPRNEFTETCLLNLFKTSNKVILIGDLNARHTVWNCHLNNKNGRTLNNFLQGHLDCVLLHTNEHTHFPDNQMTPTTIDIAVTKNVSNVSSLVVTADLNSDHNPIHLTLYNVPNQPTRRTTTTYKDSNWQLYRSFINRELVMRSTIEQPQELEDTLKSFTGLIQRAKEKVAKSFKITRQEQIPEFIIKIIKERNKFRKRWQRFGQQSDKFTMKQLNTQIKSKIQEFRNNTWNTKLRNLDPQDNSLWKMSKLLRKKYEPMPPFKDNLKTYFTDREKADLLVNHFEKVHRIEESSLTEQKKIESIIRQKLANTVKIPSQDLKWLLTTPGEVLAEIKKLSVNKAPGSDEIHNILIKNLPLKAIVQFMYIINAIIKLCHWPAQWKHAQVVPIRKVGKDPTDFKNYRPVSLLSTLGKTTERLILKRINKISNKLNTHDPHQFGFKEKHSTTQQVARIATDVIEGFKKKNTTVMVLLDIEKAFDRVWQEGLLYKMNIAGYPDYMLQLISSYLTNRTMSVKINNSKSPKRQIAAGVPQGSVLGPKLFIIYMQDMPQFPNTKLSLFADDTAIYARSHYAQAANYLLQCHTSKIEKFFNTWKIKINAQKTEQIVFSRKFTNNHIFSPLKIAGATIKPQQVVKYLGVQLDARLNYQAHIQNLINKGYKACRLLYPLLKNNSALSQKNKQILYTSVLRPVITYAAPIWSGKGKTALRPLQSFQNKMLRLVTSKDRFERITTLHDLTQLEMLEEYLTEQTKRFYNATKTNKNELIRNITRQRQQNVTNKSHKLPYEHLPIFLE